MIKRNYFKLFCLFLIFSLGFLLRLHAYLVNNSFFIDEILLSFNVIYRNYSGLIFPLDYNQSAPFLFLFLTKLVVSKMGIGEFAFRLVPFLSSVASIAAFYFLSKKVLDRFGTRCLATLLFCINFQLLFYAQAFKQYSSDVLIAILILLAAICINIKKTTWPQIFALGILSSLAFCFSFTALFVIIGVVIVYICFTKEIKKVVVYLIPTFITLTFYFVVNLHSVKNSKILNEYWAHGFNVFGLDIYKIDYNFLFTFYGHFGLFLLLFAIGIVWAYKSDKFKTSVLLSPIVVTLIAAALRFYPFERRLILFLLPILILFLVVPLDKVQLGKKPLNIIVITISAILFINYFIIYSTSFVAQKVSYLRQDVRPLLQILKKEKKKEDILYIYYASSPSFGYYNLIMDLPKDNLYLGTNFENNKEVQVSIENELKNIPRNANVWLLFVKGNGQYDKDVQIYKDWLYKNKKVKKDIVLTSARLIKVCL